MKKVGMVYATFRDVECLRESLLNLNKARLASF